jgi:hypothetical protein
MLDTSYAVACTKCLLDLRQARRRVGHIIAYVVLPTSELAIKFYETVGEAFRE